jgi:putative transposase
MRQLAENYPVQVICRVWQVPRSSYYYHSQAKDEHKLRTALQRVAGEWPRYGSRRLTAQLQREGFQVNRKHVQRLMRELGIAAQVSTSKHRTTNSAHGFPRYPNLVEQLEIVRPDQVWVCDVRRVGAYGIPVEDRRG